MSVKLQRGQKFVLFMLMLAIGLASQFLLTQNSDIANAATGINSQVNFQGKLVNTNGTNVTDGNYNVEFKLYTNGPGNVAGDTGGTLVFTEDHLVSNSTALNVASGTFQVNLGAQSGNPLPASIWNTDTIWLSIQLGNTSSCTITTTFQSNCGGDGEMLPMIRFTAAPYALNAGQLGGLSASSFGQLSANQTFTGTNLFQNSSATAFTIQNAGGTITAFNADGSTGNISINGVLQTAATASASANSNALALQSGNATGTTSNSGNVTLDAGSATGTAGTISIGTANASAITIGHGAIGVTIPTSSSLTLGASSGSKLGSIKFYDGANSNTVTLQSGATASTFNITLPTAPGSSGQCVTTTDSAGTLAFGSCAGAGSGGANTALSNLATVAINTSLLPGAAGTINLGSGSLPFGDLFIAGSSATPSSNNFRITGASTGGTRALTLPDATGTIALGSGFTVNGVAYGSTSTTIASTAAGTSGQCLVATTGSAPSWGTCAGSGSGSTLQAAYNNSTNPELTVNATNGALTIRDASTSINAPLLEVQNNTGTSTYFNVNSNGNVGVGAGTTTPTSTLDVQGTTTTGEVLSRGYLSAINNRKAAYDLDGTTINTSDWATTAGTTGGVSQNNKLIFSGGDSVWDQGVASQATFPRSQSLVFEADVKNTSSGYFMLGWKNNNNTNFSWADGAHYTYFIAGGSMGIIESGTIPNSPSFTWTTGVTYRVRTVLNPGGGAAYYISSNGGRTWTTLWAGNTTNTSSPLRLGIAYYSGGWEVSNIEVYSTQGADTIYGNGGNIVEVGGNLGVGTATPNYKLDVQGTSAATSGTSYIANINGSQTVASTGLVVGLTVTPNSTVTTGNTVALLEGVLAAPQNNSTGTVTSAYGVLGSPQNNAAGTIAAAYGVLGNPQNASTGTITTAYGLLGRVDNYSTGTIGTAYGAYIQAPYNGGGGTVSTQYALVTEGGAGNVGIGTTTPSALLSVGSSNQFQVNSSGAITAATGVTSSGAITFSTFGTAGLLHNAAGGALSSGLVNLNTGNDVTGTLAVGNGGTGLTAATQYGVLYGATTSTAAFTAAGTTGQCLVATNAAAPSWGSCGGTGSGVTLQAGYDNSSAVELILNNTNKALTIRDNGTPITSSPLLEVQNNTGTNTYFSVAASGANNTASASVSATNPNVSSTATTVNGLSVTPVGTANANTNANFLNAINLPNVTTVTNNAFYGLNVGTGYNDILRYNGTQLISGAGKLQNAAIDSSVGYNNLTGVGTLTSGSLGTGFTTVGVPQGGTGGSSFTQYGVLYGNGTSTLGVTAAASGAGLCLVSQSSAAPQWGSCAGSGSGATLQAAYDNGNTIGTSTGRDLAITLNHGGTDANLTVNIASSATGKFAVQDNGTDLLRVTHASGTVINSGNLSVTAGSLNLGGNVILTNAGLLQNVTYNGNTITPQYGGTGLTSVTLNGILYGNGTAAAGVTAAGGTGQCLMGNNAAAPTWQACGGSGSGITLQSAYNNSTATELVLNSTNGALTVQDAASPIGGNLFEVQSNLGGTTYLAVTSGGAAVTGNLTVSNSVKTPLLDTATAVPLNIGTTNATGINLNQNVSVASGKSLTLAGGIASQNGYELADAATNNLLVNGDFEQGTYGWSGLGAAVSGGYSGNNAAQTTGPATVLSDDYIPVDPTKDVFQLEGYFKKSVAGTTPGSFYFGYRAYNSSKTAITTSPCGTDCYFAANGYTLPADGNWHKFAATTTGSGTVFPDFPVGTAYVRVLALPNFGASSDAVTLMDHVTLKRLSNGPLFVGNNFNANNLVDQSQVTQLFTTSSNNLAILPPSGGNVGIGTSSPGATLDVSFSGTGSADSKVLNVTDTANAGVVNSGTRTISAISLSSTPSANLRVNSSSDGTINTYGLKQTIDLSGVQIANSVGSGNATINNYGSSVALTGVPVLGDFTGGPTSESYNVAGYNVALTSIYQNTGGITTAAVNSYGILASNSERLSNASIANPMNVYGISATASSTLGTSTAARAHYGLYASASGTANNNYGIYSDVSGAGATNNYGLYINSLAAGSGNYALYSAAAAQSYFDGNVGIGTASPAATLHVVSPNQATAATNATQALQVTGGSGGTAGAGQTGGTGAIINLTAGAGGAATAASGIPGAGGTLALVGGAGGAGTSTSANGNGGAISLQGGTPGTGGSGTAGSYGNINLQTSGGNVGIGITSPTATLHVVSSTPAAVLSGNGTAAAQILQITGGTGGATSDTAGVTGGTGSYETINTGAGGAATGASGANTGGAGGAYTLLTGAGGNATSGTGGNGGNINLTSGAGGNGPTANGSGGSIFLQGGAPGGGAGSAGSYGNVTLQLNGGNVGIGTVPNPQGKLVVLGSTGANAAIFNTSGVTGNSDGVNITAGTNSTDYALSIVGVQSSATDFYVRGDGNVGIGTNSPSGLLDVVSGSTHLLLASSSGLSYSDGVVNGFGDAGSLIPNSGFEINDDATTTVADGWTTGTISGSAPTYAIATGTSALQGANSQQITATTSNGGYVESQCFPVTNGNSYQFYASTKADNTTTSGLSMQVNWYSTKSNCLNRTTPTNSGTINGPTGVGAGQADRGGTALSQGTWARVQIRWNQPNINATLTVDSIRFVRNEGQTSPGSADLSEWIDYTGNKPTPGDVLVTGDEPISGKLSASPYAHSLIGVVSTSPYTTMGLDDGHSVILALSGRVPVKVNLENGPIQAGDKLTSSSTPGVAMKAIASGQILGTALDSYDGTQPTATVTALVGVSYWTDPSTSSIQGNSASFNSLNVGGQATISTLTVTGTTTTQSLVVTGSATIQDLTVANTITAPTLTVTGSANVGSLIVTGGATFNGNLALAGVGNTQNAITKKFKATKPIAAGSVVIADPNNDGQVTTTTNKADTRVLGVAATTAINAGDEVDVAIGGSIQVKVDSAAVVAGDLLTSSSQEGSATAVVGDAKVGTVIGKATGKPDDQGLVWLLVTLN